MNALRNKADTSCVQYLMASSSTNAILFRVILLETYLLDR